MKKAMFLSICLLAISMVVPGQAASETGKDERAIRAALERTADGWNVGDLSQYLSAYAPGATEMLALGPAGGVEAIEKTMKEGFWKTGRPLQVLRYESVVVRFVGKKAALVTGKYVLSSADRPERTGWFPTVWEKTKDRWRMIHDHS